MNITIISDVCLLENNGTAVTAGRLIENLKKRGHKVTVVSPLKDDEEVYVALKTINFFIFNKYVLKNGIILAKPDKAVLADAIKDADVVHFMLPFAAATAAVKVARKYNKAVTGGFHCQAQNVTAHLKLKDCALANKIVYKRFLRKIYRYTDIVHCPSPFIANEIKSHGYNMPIRVISNGVDNIYRINGAQKPDEYKDRFCVLFIGRLSAEKRHDLLIDAVKKSRYADKIQLIFAGEGPMKESLIRRAKGLVNPPVIGFYKKPDLVDVINYCDLYVHPSDVEIEAIACLEAISCGKVPVISDSPQSATNAFALGKENLFKAGDAKDLAQKIDYFIDNPDKLRECAARYSDYAEQFRLDRCIDKMEEMFEEAVKINAAKQNRL